MPPTGPPGPGGPYYGGPPYGGPPSGGSGRRWALVLVGALSLVLVVGLAVTGWAYATGRLGFGPLSAADEAAVTAIADAGVGPEWADEDQQRCAADVLVHEHRSEDLERRGLIQGSGEDWELTGEWRVDDARTYVEGLLECSDDWPAQVGDHWELEDTDCLEELGTETVAGYFVTGTLTLTDGEDEAADARDEAVEGLDDCYLSDPPTPRARAKPGYRAVTFTFRDLDGATTGDVQVRDGDEDWAPLRSRRHEVTTAVGGQKTCVEARVESTYPWGSSTTSQEEFCGKSKPKRVFWKRAKSCTTAPGCVKWELHYEGFASFDRAEAVLRENGGDCNSASGECTHSFITGVEGRGIAVTWSVPSGYDNDFTGRIGKQVAKLP